MAINITKLKEEDMLATLGDGDWEIEVAGDMPNFVITTQFRQDILDKVADWFVRWVKDGTDRTINHRRDPSWDSSGSVRESQADPLMLLIRHETLETWLKEEYTGQSSASYVSGSGLNWDCYEDELKELVQTKVFYFLKNQLCALLKSEDCEDIEIDEHDEWYNYEVIGISLEEALQLCIYPYQTSDIWQQYNMPTQANMQEEAIEAEERNQRHQMMYEQAKVFWETFFPQEIKHRIEMQQFDDLQIQARLSDILADTDPEIVKAIAEIGWIGDCSNSVRDFVKVIAKNALA